MYTELFKQVANYFPKWLCHLNSYQQCSSSSFTSLPTLNMVRLFSINKITGVGSHSLLQGNLPDPRIDSESPALQVDSSLSEPPGTPNNVYNFYELSVHILWPCTYWVFLCFLLICSLRRLSIFFLNAKLDVILFYDMPLIVNNLHLYISVKFHQIRSDQ